MKKKIKSVILVVLLLCVCGVCSYFAYYAFYHKSISIDLTNMTYGKKSQIKVYTLDQYEEFVDDYQSHQLEDIYITNFLFDGA